MADANDKIIVESFDSLKEVSIKDPSATDLDVMTIALSEKTTNVFTVKDMENIETLHVDVSGGALKPVEFQGNIKGLKTLEFAGSTGGAITISKDASNLPAGVTKIDASGLTGGVVDFNAIGTDVTTLIGGANADILTIGANGGTLTGGQGADNFYVGAAHDNLVTITDIGAGDKIHFNGMKTGTKVTELTVTQASDETTFVNALQKAANAQAGDSIYYATFNGDTYLIANGQAGKAVKATADIFAKVSSAKVSAAAGTVVSVTSAGVSSATVATGSLTVKGAKITGTWDGSSMATNFSASGGSVTGTVELSKSAAKANLTVSSGTPTVTFTQSAFTATSKIKLNGTDYLLSDFAKLEFSGSSDISFGVKGATSMTVTAGATTFNGATFNGITGVDVNVTGLNVTGILGGADDAMKDDIIVKLSGTHNLGTEASFADGLVSFV